MCKLFAYINHEKKEIPAYLGTKINKALRQLFYINSFGQVDGSGLMWMNKAGTTGFAKAPLPSPTFMDCTAFTSIQDKLYKNKFVAGHTRYSTVGSNSWENSHPFEFGNFIGIQNGTISNSHKTLVRGITSPCDVDSASVFWAFDKQGVDQTLSNYEGEGVFMYLNKEEKSFNIVKNDYRTLHITKILNYNVYIAATDKFALELVAERNGLQIEDVIEVVDDQLVTFTYDNKMRQRKLEVPGPSYTFGVYGGGNYNYKSTYVGKATPIGNKAVTKPANSTTVKSTTSNTVTKTTSPDNKVPSISESTNDVINTFEDNYYVQDCDICQSPIFSDDIAFGDDPDILRTDVLCCGHESCKESLEEQLGSKPVSVIMKGVF